MAGLSPTPKQQIFGSDGAPLVGGKIYTYLAGTSTPATTYTDYSAGTANTKQTKSAMLWRPIAICRAAATRPRQRDPWS